MRVVPPAPGAHRPQSPLPPEPPASGAPHPLRPPGLLPSTLAGKNCPKNWAELLTLLFPQAPRPEGILPSRYPCGLLASCPPVLLSSCPPVLLLTFVPQLAQQAASIQLSDHPVSMGHLYVLTRLATPHVGG